MFIIYFFFTTGRCKSVFHTWLKNVMSDVAKSLGAHNDVEDMILTNCTWERFGERMALGGGRQLGLFDELTSFLATMNMYSSQKNAVSDTKEYQEFLSMFNGNSRTRETSKSLFHNQQKNIFRNLVIQKVGSVNGSHFKFKKNGLSS